MSQIRIVYFDEYFRIVPTCDHALSRATYFLIRVHGRLAYEAYVFYVCIFIVVYFCLFAEYLNM